MVSTHPPTSKLSSPFVNPLVTMPKAPITIGIIVAFMFNSLFFFNSLAKSRYLSFFSHSFSFILWSAAREKSTILQILSFFVDCYIRSGLLAEIWWSMCMSKSHRSFCVSFSGTGAGLSIYYLFVRSDLNFLHISQWVTLPAQSFLVLSFCANLLHSLIMWLMVSCSHLGCVDLCKITLLCHWNIWGILTVPQGTIRGLLASSKFLPSFVLLIFSTSSVGNLSVCNYVERFLCLGPFRSMWSFFLVIQSGIFALYKHLFIFRASLSWMELNFLNEKPCIPSWPGVFQFDIFFSVVLSKLMCISAFWSLSFSSSLVILFIHSAFSLFFSCHILIQNRSVSLTSSCWYVFVSSPSCW